jgi:hypothetical protein
MALASAKADGQGRPSPNSDEKAVMEAEGAAFQALVKAKERELGRPVAGSEVVAIKCKLAAIVALATNLERKMGRPLTPSEVAEITAKVDAVERSMGRPLTEAEWADLATPAQSQMDLKGSRSNLHDAAVRQRQLEEIQAAMRRRDQLGTLAHILNPIAAAAVGAVTGGAGAGLYYAIAQATQAKGP